MFELSEKIPGYLLGKQQLVTTVLFTAFFSLVLLLVSVPSSHNVWFELPTSKAFGYTVVFILIALLVMVFSKRLMYLSRNALELTYFKYILWNLAEVVIICALYTLFTVQGDRIGIISVEDSTAVSIFLKSFAYAFMSFGIPYVLIAMYFAIQDKDNTIRLINYGNVISDEPVLPQEERKITLFDNNGALKLSINSYNLFYIESDDNYIKVWYEDNSGTLKQYMLRCRLKTVEDSFQDSDLVRCHRKYIVNMSRVKILTREKESYVLTLDAEGIEPIQVSKTYEERVLSRFNSR